jgi:hypothetical protein
VGIATPNLQVPLSTGFVRRATQPSTTTKDMLMHILGNAVTRSPGTQAWIQGQQTSATGPMRIDKGMPFKLQQLYQLCQGARHGKDQEQQRG